MAVGLDSLSLNIISDLTQSVDLLVISTYAALIISICAFGILVFNCIKLLLIFRSIKSPHVLLEVKPLRETEQSSYSTQELFNLFHNISLHRSFLERLFGIRKSLSFEIVSSRVSGIRYVIRTPAYLASLMKNSLLSYLPGIQVSEIKEYLFTDNYHSLVTELSLSNHFSLPLKSHENLDVNDPIAYITGSMTKLKAHELMAYQIVSSPVNKRDVPEVNRITKLIFAKKDLASNIHQQNGIFSKLQTLGYLVLQILLLPLGLLIFVATDGKEGPLLPLTLHAQSEKTSNPYQKELEQMIKKKLDQPLFQVSVRVLSQTDSDENSRRRNRGLVSSLTSMSSTQYQSLRPILRVPRKTMNHLKYLMFKNRTRLPLCKTILSASELGDLYHLPFTKVTKTEDMQKQFSKELPAPLSLKKGNKLDLIFAKNTYGNSATLIGLTEDERRRHMYILGATGTGKSTMLLSMITSDVSAHKGLAVIDPHGDLIEQVLRIIPESRMKDVVYFNPDDIEYPMGINLLELSQGLSDEDALREREFITESIISLFHKIYSDKYSGPRMEYILRNTIHTAFRVPGATLFTVNKLLINPKFRKAVVKNLTDENLKDFWKYEFAKAGDYQKVSMILPITNKIGRFLFSPTAKRILEQRISTINFDQIMNEGKILLCNLSKGKIGEDTSKVFGIIMLAKIQLASLKRARMKMENRKDFYLYVDEFQNFATPAFAQILSEARKYKLNAILAHQTTSQLEDRSLVNITLANTGTVVCFRTANPADETLILPQFRPFVEQGEIASLSSYRFFMRLGALNPEAPFSGITMPINVPDDDELADKIIESSRSKYASKYNSKISYLNNVIVKDAPNRKRAIKQSILP